MLKKEYRITHKKDFETILDKGKGFFTNTIGIKSIPNNLNHSRFGIIISNKVLKKAVDRNKMRRQIRGVIKLNIDKIKNGVDVIIICRPSIKELNYEQIEAELIKIFKKTWLLDNTK